MRWALVTGAGKRLGRAITLDLRAAGWGVVAHYNNSRKEAEEVSPVVVPCDLSDPDAAAALYDAAGAAAGARIEAIVNTAAIFEHDELENVSAAAIDKHMRINTLAPLLIARALGNASSVENRGAVVNFLDFKLASPYPDHFSYTLSKYAGAGAVDLLARALAPNVRVNAVSPGYILPAPGQPEADYKRLHADTPLDYGPTPEDIASAVRFLLENPAITGQTIYVDAGKRFRTHDRDMAFM